MEWWIVIAVNKRVISYVVEQGTRKMGIVVRLHLIASSRFWNKLDTDLFW